MHFDVQEFAGGIHAIFSLPEGVNEGVSAIVDEISHKNRLKQCIAEHPGLRSVALAALLKTPPKNIERWLKSRRKDAQAELIGAPKTGGYYVKTPKS